MEQGLGHSRATGALGGRTGTQGLVLGLVASLVANILIDLFMMGEMVREGLPADSGFAVIGDTAAGFFALFGVNAAGGVWPGLVWHYIIGAILGLLFGAAVTWVPAFRLSSIKKGVALGFVYTEFISLPILVLPSIILGWTAAQTVESLGFFLPMHAIWGIVLGLIVSYGLRSTAAAGRG